jgi:hypothetical protein
MMEVRKCSGNYLFLDTYYYNINDLPAGTAGSEQAYTSNDYASYNLSGGVSTVLKAKK